MRWFYRLWPERRREPGKRALVLSGGGVIGGMYEVGVLAALDEELQGFRVNDFDIFVGRAPARSSAPSWPMGSSLATSTGSWAKGWPIR